MINSVFEFLIQVLLYQYIVVIFFEGKWWFENLFYKVYKLWYSLFFCFYYVYYYILFILRKF